MREMKEKMRAGRESRKVTPLSRLAKFSVQKQRQPLLFAKLSPRALEPIW